jgi:membrane protease YdiL (CAAX protease family)
LRTLALLEPACLFASIMAYIWFLRFPCPHLWIAILGLMLLSHALHREGPRAMGFGRRSLLECAHRFAPAIAVLSLLLLAAGLLLHTTRRMASDRAFFALAAYLPWGVLQQYILNGYFLNRFDQSLSPRAASWLTAGLFTAAHAPNWFLMAVALPGGWCSTRVYRRYRNLYFLGLAHATVGFLLFLTVPDSISQHLDVGPGFVHRWHAHGTTPQTP